jgi:hypothetical protein
MEQEQNDLESRHRTVLRGIKDFDRVAIARRASKANEVIDWRAFSWTRLFNRLESVLPYKIKMTSVRPIFRSREREFDESDPRRSMPVKVEGLARDWEALFKLQDDLFKNESFGVVNPRNINKLDNGELAFSIEFTYYPDEPIALPDSAPIEDVPQIAASEPPTQAGDTPVEPVNANAAAERRKLPQASGEPAEVTDEWMGQAEAAPEANAAATQTPGPAKANTSRAKKNTVRQPPRRTLPKVDPADDDDGANAGDAGAAGDEGERR